MRCKIKGEEVIFNNAEVMSAKKQITRYLKTVEKYSFNRRCPTYYFTFLVMMNMISGQILDEIDAESLQRLNELFKTLPQKEYPETKN